MNYNNCGCFGSSVSVGPTYEFKDLHPKQKVKTVCVTIVCGILGVGVGGVVAYRHCLKKYLKGRVNLQPHDALGRSRMQRERSFDRDLSLAPPPSRNSAMEPSSDTSPHSSPQGKYRKKVELLHAKSFSPGDKPHGERERPFASAIFIPS